MALVRKDFVLLRQEGATGIHHVDARQVVLARDVLRTQMLLHRHRIVSAALDGRIVGDDHAFPARHAADSGDDAGGVNVPAIEIIGGERRQLEKGGAGIDQQIDPLTGQQLAAGGMPCPRGFPASPGHQVELLAQIGDQRPHGFGISGKIGRFGINPGMKRHGPPARSVFLSARQTGAVFELKQSPRPCPVRRRQSRPYRLSSRLRESLSIIEESNALPPGAAHGGHRRLVGPDKASSGHARTEARHAKFRRSGPATVGTPISESKRWELRSVRQVFGASGQ